MAEHFIPNALDPNLQINVTALEWVADMIGKFPNAYNQLSFGENNRSRPFLFDPNVMQSPECGSACCIAGWGFIYATQDAPGRFGADEIANTAQAAFGLTDHQAAELFEAYPATAEDGIKAIRELIETEGKIIWGDMEADL